MKKSKLAISLVLFLLGFIFSGELSMLYLNNFTEKYYNADFYLNASASEISSNEMIRDFKQSAKKCDVDFFVVKSSWDKSYLSTVTIIGTKGALDELKCSGIRTGLNKSIFFENSKVIFKKYKAGVKLSNCTTYYFIGDKSNYQSIRKFKASLVDKYGGGFPHELGSDRETILNLVVIWGTIFCIIIFLSLYEITLMKKEYAVRTILGESPFRIFVRSITVDAIGFSLEFLGMGVIISHFSNAFFKFEYVILVFCLFLLINSLIQTLFLNISYRRDLVDGTGKTGLLRINYCIKAIVSVLLMIVLSINFVTVSQAYNLYRQKSFFKEHSACEYYNLNFSGDEEYQGFSQDEYIYRKLYSTFHDKAYQYVDMTGYYSITYPMVLINRNAFLEMCENNPSITEKKSDILRHDVSIVFPAKIKIGSTRYENALEIFSNGFLCGDNEEYNAEFYSGNINLVGIHDTGNSAVYNKKLYSTPIIIVDNSEFNPKASYSYDPYYNHDIMYKLTDEEYQQFVSKYSDIIESTNKTNVLQEYEFSWKKQKQELELSLLLMFIILLIEATMIVNVLRMEYRMNAIELALKKIHGYSLFDRNKKMIWLTIISNLIGSIAGIVLSIVCQLDIHLAFFIAVVMGVSLFEIACIVFYAEKSDQQNISSILKGEKL